MSHHILVEFGVDLRLRDSENAGPTRSERKMADEIERLRGALTKIAELGEGRGAVDSRYAAIARAALKEVT